MDPNECAICGDPARSTDLLDRRPLCGFHTMTHVLTRLWRADHRVMPAEYDRLASRLDRYEPQD